MAWWLISEDGVRRRLGPRGLVLGRSEDCDVVLNDPKASGMHVLLVQTSQGVLARALGRNATRLDGRPLTTQAQVQDLSTLQVPGASFRLVRTQPEPTGWVLLHGLVRYGLRASPLTIGSGPDVDLLLPGWPPAAAVLTTVQDQLVVQALAPLRLDGEALSDGAVELLSPGSRLGWQGEEVAVRPVGSVAVVAQPNLPQAASFTVAPPGGRLELAWASGRVSTVALDRASARLIAALMRTPGQPVADVELAPHVLPDAKIGPEGVAALVHRTRHQLLSAGLCPVPLLSRSDAATWLCLADGAETSLG